MSLFGKLLSLHGRVTPEENFFTEVFAAVLEQNIELQREFLRSFFGIVEQYKKAEIKSQVHLPGLPEHETGSRPDIVIRVFYEDQKDHDLIFIESKLGSPEGKNQVLRYIDHLASPTGSIRKRTLLYITRSYDPKDDIPGVITKNGIEVNFVQKRWRDFYTLLNDENFRKDTLVNDLAKFMEEHRMAGKAKLKQGDLQVIAKVPRLMQFMMSSLDEDIKEDFQSIVGVKPLSLKDMFNRLSDENYFMLVGNIGTDISVSIGYSFDGEAPDYPTLALTIENMEGSSHWEKYAKILREIANSPSIPGIQWKSYELDNPKAWAGIYTEEPLSKIPEEIDPMHYVKDKFSFYLEQVANLKKTYRALPWNSSKP